MTKLKIKVEESINLKFREKFEVLLASRLLSKLNIVFIFNPSCPLSGPPAVPPDFPGVWNKPCNWGEKYIDVGAEIKWGVNK